MSPPVSRARSAVRASSLSRGRLTTLLRKCGYSEATASAAAGVFDDVIEALRKGGFPNPAIEVEAQDALRRIKKIADQYT